MAFETDIDFMKQAMDLALKGRGSVSPNPMVGAILVKNKKIIAKGYHRRCGADHAEIMAIKKAGHLARGAKLYLTLEPCCHYGRTPPCVDAIISSGIKEVIIGMKDPNSLVNGKSIRKLQKAKIKIKAGILEDELKRMNESFIKYIKKGIPFVVIKSAQTLDGKIATANGQSKWITQENTRDFSHYLRDDFDAILVGINTVLKDNPGLNGFKKTKKIKKVILDSSLRLQGNEKLFKATNPKDIYIATTQKAKKKKIEQFRDKGMFVIVYPKKKGPISIEWLLKKLALNEITSVFIEGGAKTIGSALKEKVVDKVFIFIAPKIMGDQGALSAVTGLKPKHVRETVRLKDLEFWKAKDDIFVAGYIETSKI